MEGTDRVGGFFHGTEEDLNRSARALDKGLWAMGKRESKPINYVHEVYPKELCNRLIAVGPAPIIKIRMREYPTFEIEPTDRFPFRPTMVTLGANDFLSIAGLHRWLHDGPKIVRPTLEECQAMIETEVNIEPEDYHAPFPAILIELPIGVSPKFSHVLSFYDPTDKVLVNQLSDRYHPGLNDIVNIIKMRPDISIEEVIRKYSKEVSPDEAVEATNVTRIAINLCLLMTNFGCRLNWHREKERHRNEDLHKRGKMPRERLAMDLQVATIEQKVEMFKVSEPAGPWQGGTHSSPKPHWRKGHWRRYPTKENGERKPGLIRIPPVLVMAGSFVGKTSDTTVVYEG